jgi:hypothetical protein
MYFSDRVLSFCSGSLDYDLFIYSSHIVGIIDVLYLYHIQLVG